MKILHIAPQNYAGVPYDFMQMHNHYGDFSRLITLHKNPINFPEDICLDFPLPNFSLAKKWRRKKVEGQEIEKPQKAQYFRTKNIFEKEYFYLSDMLRKTKIEEAFKQYSLDDFDIIHYDGGLDFFRDSRQALKWKTGGKRIVCCYYGSDLRIRGLIKEMDEISDLNITSEFDHLALRDNIKYLFYPYNTSELPKRKETSNEKIRIVHSPTNRIYKGTELILRVVERIKKERDIEFLLLEGVERNEVLARKSQADICIDQVGGKMGGTGYGKAGLETLGMGVPTFTNMSDEYAKWLPENPFIVANDEKSLFEKLMELIDNEGLRKIFGDKGIEWVKKYHGFENVNSTLYDYYKNAGIV